MSCASQKDRNQTIFSSGTPHFFKIILEETLQENKLRIPQRFVRRYGETLSNLVFVKLPCGSKWKMKLKKEKDNIWLEKGWPDFVKHYSIKRGSMLTFRYEGNSEFHAVIFDTSTVEIDYPSIPINFDRSDIDLELQAPIEKVVQILDDLSTCPKAREKSPLPCSQPHKRMRMSPNGETQRKSSDPISEGSRHSKCILDNSMSKENFQSSEPELIGKHDWLAESDTDKSTIRSQRIHRILRHLKPLINRKENVASLQKASDFKSKCPFFKVVIRPSNLYGDHLKFSPQFAMRHLKYKSSDVTFIVSSWKRRTWSVAYSFKAYKRIKTARFKSGWSTFARDNNLEVGDTCVFVLLEDTRTAFEVVIFRGNENSKSLVSSANEGGKIKMDVEEILTNKTQPGCSLGNFPGKETSVRNSDTWKRTKLHLKSAQRARILLRVPFESEKPFFKILMQPTYVDSVTDQLRVPLDFAIRYIKDKGDVVLSVPNGRLWSAEFRMNLLAFKNPGARICNGWNQFVKGNNLEVGDVCIFKLLDGTGISFEVSIVRFDEYECDQWSQAGNYTSEASKPKGDMRVKIEID